MKPVPTVPRADSGAALRAGARGGRGWRSLVLFLLTAVALAARPPGEYEVKAAFLYNFARFVEWPEAVCGGREAPVVIGVVGQDPFGESLAEMVRAQTARGRRIEIRHFRPEEEFETCHIVFLSGSVARDLETILARLRGRPVLTVGDQAGFIELGGTIGFALVDHSVRFDINLGAATSAELKISAKLLAVARTVVRAP